MSYRFGATQAEIKRGLVFNADLRRGADRVVKQNGVITGSVPFTPVGADLPGTASNYIRYNIPPHMCDVQDSGKYLTVIMEFYPDLTYTTDANWDLLFTTVGETFYFLKRNNAGSNAIRVHIGGANIVDIAQATYGSLWNTLGRNQIAFSSIDGDTNVWFNGSQLVNSDATAYSYSMQPTELDIGCYAGGGANLLPGVVSFVKMFKGAKFTTDDISAYWNNKITARPEEAASYWFFDGARHDTTNVRTLDITHNERHLTFGDGSTSTTYPTKLAKHGYSFDGGDYLTGSTEPAITASESFTLECEFTLDNVAGFHGLIARANSATNNNLFLRVDDGKIEFYFRESTDSNNRQWEETGTSIQFGHRYHIIFQHTFGTATSTRCFLDGREVAGAWAAGGSDQPLENAALTWQVGDRGGGADQPITGDIYHAGVWEEYLSSLECYDLYVKALNRRNRV